MKIVIINGYPTSGKDTFVECCKEFAGIKNILTSTPAKYALQWLGWDGVKTDTARDILSTLIEISYEMWDGPIKYVLEEIDRGNQEIVFIHCREPENIDKLKKAIHQKVYTVFVDRQESRKPEYNNSSDSDVENYEYDLFIDNNGTLNDLKRSAEMFVNLLLGGRV